MQNSDIASAVISRRKFASMSGAAVLGLGGVPLTSADENLTYDERRSDTESSFSLRLTITGQCMCVRDPAYGQMHVLLPRTGPETGAPVHLPRLIYDVAYEIDGSTAPYHQYKFVGLEGAVLDLTRLETAAPLNLQFPYEVADLDPVVQEPVVREHIESGKETVARLSLGAGAVTGFNPGGRWDFGTETGRHMAIAVDWTISGIDERALAMALCSFTGREERQLPRLHPIDGSIHLHLYHTPSVELPPFDAGTFRYPAPRSVASHFTSFYALFRNPATTPLPVYAGHRAGNNHHTASQRTPVGAPNARAFLGRFFECIQTTSTARS